MLNSTVENRRHQHGTETIVQAQVSKMPFLFPSLDAYEPWKILKNMLENIVIDRETPEESKRILWHVCFGKDFMWSMEWLSGGEIWEMKLNRDMNHE